MRALRRPAWLVKKGEQHDDLKFCLLAFYEPWAQTPERRLCMYEQLDRLFVTPAQHSGIRLRGLKSIFYARYFTMHALAAELFPGQLAFDRYAPSKRFEACVEENHPCVYERAVLAHMGNAEEARAFLALEAKMFAALNEIDGAGIGIPAARLRDMFGALNGETLHHVKDALEPDVRRLSRVSERVHAFVTLHAPMLVIVLAAILAVNM